MRQFSVVATADRDLNSFDEVMRMLYDHALVVAYAKAEGEG